jgi:thymidylate kinase
VSTRTENRLRVALVGADGAGKSTVSEMLERTPLPFPVKRIYMGVNLEASTLMLPTTRLLLAAKRARGGRPDLVASSQATPSVDRPTRQVTGRSEGRRRPWRRSVKDGTRLTVWMLEEWLRQLVAAGYSSRGYIVVFDRHFYADYYHTDIAAGPDDRAAFARFHGWMLQHAYPKPDLVVCLDAPADVLFSRKPEASREWLEQRRQQYLALAGVVPAFVVVDADRPLDTVFTEVVESIRTHWKAPTP